MEDKNFKLELIHRNGKKSELSPLSFKYTIEDLSQVSFDLSSSALMPKTDYVEDNISNFYKIFGKSSWPIFYHINSIICKFNENDEIYNIFKSLQGCENMMPCKQDIISEGKMQIETINEVEKLISDFQLHQCVPNSIDYDNNTIEISMDYIELIDTPKSKIKNSYGRK